MTGVSTLVLGRLIAICFLGLKIGPSHGQPIFMEAAFETGYTGLDMAPLKDNDDNTCVDFKPHWTFLPVTTFRQDHTSGNAFSVKVVLGADVETVRADVLRVMASNDGVQTGDYYPAAETYTKCTVSATANEFDCTCTAPCSYYVQLVFDDIDDATSEVKICEI